MRAREQGSTNNLSMPMSQGFDSLSMYHGGIMDKLEMRYFVLKPSGDGLHAHASREAMKAYAITIQATYPEFAQDLLDWRRAEINAVVA